MKTESGEMAQQIGVLAALAENLSLVLSTNIKELLITCNSVSRVLMASSGLKLTAQTHSHLHTDEILKKMKTLYIR